MSLTISTFNINNLFLRYRFGCAFAGDRGGKSATSNNRRRGSERRVGPPVAVDRRTDSIETFGYLPVNQPGMFEIFSPEQREMAARTVRRGGHKAPTILCLQEVESLIALRRFNEEFLGGEYEHAVLLDARDFRQIDVGVLSKVPITRVRSWMDLRDPADETDYLFSRDCLEVDFELNKSGSSALTLFVNHFKSKLASCAGEKARAEKKAQAAAKRHRQARGVIRIVRDRFSGDAFNHAWFAVVGDLNDEPASPTLRPLYEGSGLVDALARLANPEDRWTDWYRSGNQVSQLDHMLLSPALDKATRGSLPQIERRGIGFARTLSNHTFGPRQTKFVTRDDDPNHLSLDFQFNRFPGVDVQINASDHCPVFFELPTA